MDDATIVVVMTTLPAASDADEFGRVLVEERLAACVTIVNEARAIYRWQGEVCDDQERQLLIKTSRGRVADLETRVRALHPYDVPEFLVLPVAQGSTAYLTWVRESTAQ